MKTRKVLILMAIFLVLLTQIAYAKYTPPTKVVLQPTTVKVDTDEISETVFSVITYASILFPALLYEAIFIVVFFINRDRMKKETDEKRMKTHKTCDLVLKVIIIMGLIGTICIVGFLEFMKSLIF